MTNKEPLPAMAAAAKADLDRNMRVIRPLIDSVTEPFRLLGFAAGGSLVVLGSHELVAVDGNITERAIAATLIGFGLTLVRFVWNWMPKN